MTSNKIELKQSVIDAKFVKTNLNKLITDLSSERYHSLFGTWSSSQFKDILDDEDLFIKKYIKREVERVEREAFDTGTYFHTAVLEPEKVEREIAMYPGKTRIGKNWDAFKKANPGKVVITPKQKEEGDGMMKAVQDSPKSQEYLVGMPEVSLFVELVVYAGDIYAPKFGKILTREGWEDFKGKIGGGFTIIVKVRADMLGEDYVSDLKSTSKNARSTGDVRSTISAYKYDLSAALYLDMFALVRPKVRDFIWIFASKKYFNAAPWRASRNQLLVGRAKYSKAMIKMADCAQCNWELVDYLREADPLPYEMEWLREKETDLL